MVELLDTKPELWLTAGSYTPLNLTGLNVDEQGFQFTIEALADDATFDMPQPIDVAVQRWMADGAIASTQGHDNRTPYFQVIISATSTVALNMGEAALIKRATQPGLLKWISPEGAPQAPASIFEVWTWHLEPVFDDTDEFQLSRVFGLRFTAKPWVRSENLTVVPAIPIPGSPTTTQIDACTSTTGWSANGTLTTSGGAVKNTATGIPNHINIELKFTRTGVTGLGSTNIVMIDSTVTNFAPSSMRVVVDGLDCTKVAQIGTISYWQMPAGKTSFNVLDVSTYGFVYNLPPVFSIADVSKTDTIGGIGSSKQLSRRMDVGGAVKTSGSIQVASPSATSLGTVLVYTRPDDGLGLTSSMRQFRTSGGTVTTDSTCVSGKKETFVTSGGASVATLGYQTPAGWLPEGQYVLVGRFIFAGATTITVTLTGGTSLGVGPSASGDVSAPAAGVVWKVVCSLALPGLKVPAESTQPSGFSIAGAQAAGTTGAAAVSVDEFYLLNVTTGVFTLVSPFQSYTRLWIDAPDYDTIRNRPSIYFGNAVDRSDAKAALQNSTVNPGVMHGGDVHLFHPDGMIVDTVTDGVDNALVSGSFYHRWLNNAGD